LAKFDLTTIILLKTIWICYPRKL